MATAKKATGKGTEDDFTISWVFNAPRDKLFRAWTEPDQFKKWYGPRHFTVPVARMELRPGGAYFSCMRSPDGRDFCSIGVVKDVKAPERLAYTDSFADKDGNPIPSSKLGMDPSWPENVLVEVTISEQGPMSKVTVRMGLPRSLAERNMVPQGWAESFVKLADYLETG